MEAEDCGLVNFDVLLMEGFICHVCLPNPCTNEAPCVHHDGIYTLAGSVATALPGPTATSASSKPRRCARPRWVCSTTARRK